MRLSRFLAVGAGAMLSTGTALAQVHLNEIFASMTMTDDMEFVELIGPPGMSLNGYVIAVVESDWGNSPTTPPMPAGSLDRIWDLTGQSIPASGYFVLGDQAVPNVNLNVGTQDIIENSSATFYLIETSLPGVLVNLGGQDVDLDDDGITELLVGDPNVIQFESIALVDDDPQDIVFDCSPAIGPDGTFFPAGIFRPGDYPTNFCDNEYLDFFIVGSPTAPAPTPGAANPASLTGCTMTGSGAGCNPMGPIGSSYCGPAVPNSTGSAGEIAASGSTNPADNSVTLTSSALPPGQFGYFLAGQSQGMFNPPGSSGFICLSGNIGRYNGNIGQGPGFSLMLNLGSIPVNPPQAVMSGESWNFQCWYRDIGNTSNFTDGVNILFQ
ncbi:MAG: hypothetical protein GY711_01495 [bacterium]|nr:hypothetical protein [bacterium]